MTRAVADERLGKFARQQADLFRRVSEGTIDIDFASRELQKIIQGETRFEKDATPQSEPGKSLLETARIITTMMADCLFRPKTVPEAVDHYESLGGRHPNIEGYMFEGSKPAVLLITVDGATRAIPNTTVWQRLEETQLFEACGEDWPGSRVVESQAPAFVKLESSLGSIRNIMMKGRVRIRH